MSDLIPKHVRPSDGQAVTITTTPFPVSGVHRCRARYFEGRGYWSLTGTSKLCRADSDILAGWEPLIRHDGRKK